MRATKQLEPKTYLGKRALNQRVSAVERRFVEIISAHPWDSLEIDSDFLKKLT